MKLNYVTKIECNLKNYKRIHTRKMTTRLIDGSYKSVYKGRSMNFEDIRDYVAGDDVKDIDWKASARSRKLLVRQYTAEKKHNIMLVMDTNKRMLADTDKSCEKWEVALLGVGTLAYLVNQNGDYISSTYATDTSINHTPFRTGLTNLENILQGYHKSVTSKNNSSMENVLNYICKTFRNRMILVVVTDIEGINEISESTLKKILVKNDMLFINVKSAKLDGNRAFDVRQDKYLPDFFARDKKLIRLQHESISQMETNCINKLKKYGIAMTSVEDTKNLDDNIIKLLHR